MTIGVAWLLTSESIHRIGEKRQPSAVGSLLVYTGLSGMPFGMIQALHSSSR